MLQVEQMLTTGGGWQDQVGGLVPGAKIARSAAALPLEVKVQRLAVSPEAHAAIDDSLMLVYTGLPRLARNLLQDVIRNWYSRSPAIVAVCEAQQKNAEEAADAFERGDLEAVGACLSRYRLHKKELAPGSEPPEVTTLLTQMKPHIYGAALCGAGGGGFLAVFCRPGRRPLCEAMASRNAQMQVWKGSLDSEGCDIVESESTFEVSGHGRVRYPALQPSSA